MKDLQTEVGELSPSRNKVDSFFWISDPETFKLQDPFKSFKIIKEPREIFLYEQYLQELIIVGI